MMMRFILISLILISCSNPLDSFVDSTLNFCAHSDDEFCENNRTPVLQSSSIPASSTYVDGASLNIDLTFDEDVTVSGTPALTLNIGRYQKSAVCASQSAKVIRCSYTLGSVPANPDLDFDGVSFNSYDTGSGQIEGTNGKVADLSSLSLNLSGIIVHFSEFTNWLDATDSSTLFANAGCTTAITDGANINCWVDKKTSQQLSTASPPSYSLTGGPASTPTAFFDRNHVAYPTPITLNNFTVFAIYNVTVFRTLNYFIGSLNGSTDGIGFGFGGTWTGGPAGDGLYVITRTGVTFQNLSSTSELASFGLATYTNSQIFRDTNEATPYTATDTLTTPHSFSWIGQREDDLTCCMHTGNISEVMIYNQVLSTEKREEVWCYLSNKYSLGFSGC